MIVKIGKAPDNDYRIDDAQISRYHARLSAEPQQADWLLEDLDSANGTFVNGIQIVRKRITAGDEIRFGMNHHTNLGRIVAAKNDYSEAFAALKPVYDRYIQQKIKIQSGNQFKARLFQALPFALPGVIGIVIGFLGKGNPLLFGCSLFVAICAPVVGIYFGAKQAAKVPSLLHALGDQFKIDYVCPKCGTFLGEVPWESLRNRQQCPVSSCKANWVRK